ncbi:D-alanyl-D-alanine carboxypeptidase family protein [Aneurinibacillus terranovensis]|uniref:D-alanyl-D-alanine carboxypeptidase family protein n=1 Tax=Aneurinibacillus terranovensis TaxID=278991 RepID=UPI00041F3A43|nr:D-alanyl-D-alanine carboxypeptidase family protein [Aneurinibacillus terranovensis]
MKWLLPVIILIQSILLLCILPGFVQAAPVQSSAATINNALIHSDAAVLMDARSGYIVYQKNPEKVLFPASITKIVTGILAIEHGNLNDMVTVSKNARNVEGTRVYLAEGEQKRMEDLVYGMLINSGNDAAVAIAEHMDGSIAAFSKRMNEFVASIGATHTHFTNPDGLYDKDHYTTAEDMAKITAYAMKNEKFRSIVGTKEMLWNGKEWKTKLINHNKMLFTYPGANGVKNGFTDQSRFTLVTSAQRNGTELLAILMKADSSQQIYDDTKYLLDYGFSHYKTVRILNEGQHVVTQGERYTNESNVYATIPRNDRYQVKIEDAHHVMVLTSSGKTEEYALPAMKAEQSSKETQSQSTVGDAPLYFKISAWCAMLLCAGWLSLWYIRRRA